MSGIPPAIPVPICDPHFHMWDAVATPNPNLGGIVDLYGVYNGKSHAADIAGLDYRSAVHVEAVVGQVEGGHVLDAVAETKFVVAEAGAGFPGVKLAVVPFVHLGREDTEAVIAGHRGAAGAKFAGIRMILNYSHDDASMCWPQVGTDAYLKGKVPGFDKGFALLGKHGLTFDLHCNWNQLADAAAYLATHTGTDVVLDHLGCLKLGSGSAATDSARIAEWRAGMRAMAANPRVVGVKVSNLGYTDAAWIADPGANARMRNLVREVIGMFGVERIMFASNWPVDKLTTTTSLTVLYAALHGLVHDFTLAERTAMFHDNAARVYKLAA